jgi:poly-gamma-glutamate synthesis protein (capsule biosynthesis protein)
LETNLSLRGTASPQARLPMRAHPESAGAIRDAGFNVVSFAGNHCMDWGREAFFDTIESLEEQGISVIGVGNNIEEARRPARLEIKGTKIAFLAYNSILPMAYWAEVDRPGCVPMRAWTFYEQIEHDQPGTPCRIHTSPHRDDLKAMVEDIQKAKSENDIVILSMHWGIHFVPALLADYQREIARVAIDSGADLIIGHHAHILKGMEVYKGKVVTYSLGNFAIEQPAAFMEQLYKSRSHKEIEALNPLWKTDEAYPLPPETKRTMIIKCVIKDKGISRISFLPAYLNVKCDPEVLSSRDKRFEEVIEYMNSITLDQGLDTTFVPHGDEIVIGNI